MPIYEYHCRTCEHDFEELVLDAKAPPCPSCKGTQIERLLSMFSVSSEGTRQLSLNKARKKNSKIHRDKAIAEHEEMHHHHH